MADPAEHVRLCGGLRLRVRIHGPLPTLPGPEPDEPVAGALARLLAACRATGALLELANPAEALGPGRMGLAAGVPLLGIGSDADEACWDELLSLGLPAWGLRGATDPADPSPEDLAWGRFRCCEGLRPSVREDRHGIEVEHGTELEAAVIVRGGFEAARLRGRRLAWRDRGGEGYVRLAISGPGGRCWTQPRFTAPSPAHGT